MKFALLDRVIEIGEDRIVAVKNVSLAEEYLADHFPGFPVLPGVMMIETMVQAARRLAATRTDRTMVLGEVRALTFNSMVRPGEGLRVEITLMRENDDGSMTFKGSGSVIRTGNDDQAQRTGERAVAGRFTLRPVAV